MNNSVHSLLVITNVTLWLERRGYPMSCVELRLYQTMRPRDEANMNPSMASAIRGSRSSCLTENEWHHAAELDRIADTQISTAPPKKRLTSSRVPMPSTPAPLFVHVAAPMALPTIQLSLMSNPCLRAARNAPKNESPAPMLS